jgi:hypothetical protein
MVLSTFEFYRYRPEFNTPLINSLLDGPKKGRSNSLY